MHRYWDSDKAQSWTGAMVLTIVAVMTVFLEVDAGNSLQYVTFVSLLSLLQICCFITFISDWGSKRKSRQVTMLCLQALLILLLYLLVDFSFIAIMGIVWIVQATELFTIRTAAWLLVASVMVFTASQFWHFHDRDFTYALIMASTLSLFHLFAVIATHRANREQQLREHTAGLYRELIATRELLSQSARQSERLRISRDLHDLLGHHLTALILNLEITSHKSEGKALEHVQQSLSLGKLLLSDLRNAVSELRDTDSIDLKNSVSKLIADIPGIDIQMDFSAAPAIHDVETAETLLRCIQEGLTNILRHSKASNCRIALSEHYNDYFLVISDNGREVREIKPGNGLKGMRERIEQAGGEVSWKSGEEGFLLQLKLPAGVA